MPGLLIALVLACPLAAAAATTTAPEKGTTLLLFDGQHTLKSMPHVKIVDDPFATTQPAAGRAATQPEDLKVLKGGPLGPEEAYQNKGTFPADHFVMPAGGQVELVVVVAMKRLTDLKVEVWARDPKGGMKFRTTLPPEANTAWQAVIVPIDATRIQPGSTIDDITIFQVGKDDAARLFIRSVSVRVK